MPDKSDKGPRARQEEIMAGQSDGSLKTLERAAEGERMRRFQCLGKVALFSSSANIICSKVELELTTDTV